MRLRITPSEDLYRTGAAKRVLLVRPPARYWSLSFPDGPRVGLPLGLLYLASALRDGDGIETSILDSLVHADLSTLASQTPPIRFGMQPREIAERARDFAPDVVGIGSNFGAFFDDAIETIEALREALPGALLIAGGADVSARPEEYLERAPGLDAAVLGEGEVPLRNLLGRLRHGRDWSEVPGLVIRQGDRLHRTPPQPSIMDLDSYRLDFDRIDLEQYFRLYAAGYPSRVSYEYPGAERAVSLVTSRGCPYECIFCSIQVHMGHRFRWHEAEYVVDQIRTLVERYDVRHLHFEDDNLTLHKPRFKAILRGIIEGGLDITWDTPNGVRADILDEEIIALSKASGCVYLMFGVESGNQRVVNEIVKKDLDLEDVRRAARLCHETGIDTAAFYIGGFPGETMSDIEDTVSMATELHRKYWTRPHFGLARPLAGTELYRIAKEHGLLIDTDTMDPAERARIPAVVLGRQMIETQEFTLESLAGVVVRYRRRFLLQSAVNWMIAASRQPLAFARSLGSPVRAALRHPRSARTALYRYFVRQIIFPHALGRRFAAAERPRRVARLRAPATVDAGPAAAERLLHPRGAQLDSLRSAASCESRADS